VRWPVGRLRAAAPACVPAVPADPWQQIDTTARPVQYARRHGGPGRRGVPCGWRAGYGWDATHPEWGFGFRL